MRARLTLSNPMPGVTGLSLRLLSSQLVRASRALSMSTAMARKMERATRPLLHVEMVSVFGVQG